MSKILSTALFKIVNLVALLGYLFNIISMFDGSNSCYYGPEYTYEQPTYYNRLNDYPNLRQISLNETSRFDFNDYPVLLHTSHNEPTTDAGSIVNGVFHVFSFLALLYIEVDQSPVISNVVPFLFSFAGRGVFFMWLAWTTFSVSILSIIGSIFTFIVGVIYVFLFVLKNMKTPQHMSFDDTLFSGVSKFFADSGDESESFLPTHSSSNNHELNASSSVV